MSDGEVTELALSQEDLLWAVEEHLYLHELARPPCEVDITLLGRTTPEGGSEFKAVIKITEEEAPNIITDHLGTPQFVDLSPRVPSPDFGEHRAELAELRLERRTRVIENAKALLDTGTSSGVTEALRALEREILNAENEVQDKDSD